MNKEGMEPSSKSCTMCTFPLTEKRRKFTVWSVSVRRCEIDIRIKLLKT